LKGRKKQWYREALNTWSNTSSDVSPVRETRILRPAELTVYNQKLVYHAIYKAGNLWKLYDPGEDRTRFEWYLVRLDQYGNTMFLNQVGKGASLELSIPRKPEYYNLYLETIVGDNVKVVHTTLNTPFE